MREEAVRLADKIRGADEVHIVSHIDADGITSAAIAYSALSRSGKEVDFEFVKQLESRNIEGLKKEDHELIWFTDLGSGQSEQLDGLNCVITDHHKPPQNAAHIQERNRGNILSYCYSDILELNPHRHGIDGATELSGAGTTYLVAQELGDNRDLTKLAVVGAVGDLQASKEGRLIGKNREILDEGISGGFVTKRTDALLYGLESRPLSKLLGYATDPLLPGLSGEEEACVNFLDRLDIPLKEGNEWRYWYDLEKEEKRKILSELSRRLIDSGFPPSYTDSLIGEVYTFPDEEWGTMLHQAKEFSTLLNACGRYGKGEIGLKVCSGDRDEYLKKALDLLRGHRRVLVDCLNVVESVGVEEGKRVQYFFGGDRIPETVLGTVVGMALGSGDYKRSMPMIGFAESDDEDGLKVSSRGTKKLVDEGLDLSCVMSECSAAVGGEGGGHDIAAGAFIPEGEEGYFIELADEKVGRQLDKR